MCLIFISEYYTCICCSMLQWTGYHVTQCNPLETTMQIIKSTKYFCLNRRAVTHPFSAYLIPEPTEKRDSCRRLLTLLSHMVQTTGRGPIDSVLKMHKCTPTGLQKVSFYVWLPFKGIQRDKRYIRNERINPLCLHQHIHKNETVK